MHQLELPGLHPRPLASYLAALGLFKVIATQADPTVRASWAGDMFRLSAAIDQEMIQQFLLDSYSPTPLIAPWNGKNQGGFAPGDNGRASKQISRIADSKDPRLARYRDVVLATRAIVARQSWQEANEANDKRATVLALRNELPDPALAFLDASVAITSDGREFPPIFGTGGNIGRLDLVLGYLEHLERILDPGKGDRPVDWLVEVLTGEPAPGVKSTPGQFDYQGVGGPNLARSGSAPEQVNPWLYVLSIEGALLFAASASKRLGSQLAKGASPFTVASSATGFASSAVGESNKGEMWMPLWESSWRLTELETLLSEGRATWQGRAARTGTDFLRATRSLGTDRGVAAFERFGFLERNGQSPAAVPLGRVVVRSEDRVRLTAEVDGWVRRLQGGGDRAPASVVVARNQVADALFRASESPSPELLLALLVSLARAEQAVFRSTGFREMTGIGPVPTLSAEWLPALANAEKEFCIAWALTAGRDRLERSGQLPTGPRTFSELVRPIELDRQGAVRSFTLKRQPVAGLGVRSLVEIMADSLLYRCRTAPEIAESETLPLRGIRPQFELRPGASGRDRRLPSELVEMFAAGLLDDLRVADWLLALSLIGPNEFEPEISGPLPVAPVPLWRCLAPQFGQARLRVIRSSERSGSEQGPTDFHPVVRTSWPVRLTAGQPSQIAGVLRELASAYRASGLDPAFDPTTAAASVPDQPSARRVLAALMLPTRLTDLTALVENLSHLN